MRTTVLTPSLLCLSLSLLCVASRSNAQQPEHDPYRPPSHISIEHHAEMVGQLLPDVTLIGANGKEVALSSYRGKPLLVDLWATWCGPCLAALPSLNRLYAEVKDKGIEFISFDEVGDPVDEDKDAAGAVSYLARHHYDWKNIHDGDRKVATALQCDGLPLALLIDANGKIVYFDFGGNEADLRKAIAGLGPQFAFVAPSVQGKPDAPRDPSDQK